MLELAFDPAPPAYDRADIFRKDGPFSPDFMCEAVRALMRALPLDPSEPEAWQDRRMANALLALSALHPRDEIEVMLGVQALAAYHAAAACWHLGMNHHAPNGDSTRHLSAASTAARTFETMLRALERRQAKPLAIPAGRPAAPARPEPPAQLVMQEWMERCQQAEDRPDTEPASVIVWTPADRAIAEARIKQDRIEAENEGLDIANTEGILPGGGMILPEDPTPQQEAYLGRRLSLMYKREHEENLRRGIKEYPKIRGIRPGDLIP